MCHHFQDFSRNKVIMEVKSMMTVSIMTSRMLYLFCFIIIVVYRSTQKYEARSRTIERRIVVQKELSNKGERILKTKSTKWNQHRISANKRKIANKWLNNHKLLVRGNSCGTFNNRHTHWILYHKAQYTLFIKLHICTIVK